MRVDPTGHIPFFVITAALGAVAGAIIGGLVASNTGGNVWTGIAIGAAAGALIGTGVGAAAGAALAGSLTASTAAVIAGGKALVATVGSAGVIAGAKMISDNFSHAINNTPEVFWSGGDLAKNAARELADEIGGKTLEMTSLGEYLEKTNANYCAWRAASMNFANVAANSGSTIYTIQNSAGINIQSTWAQIEYNILKCCSIVYGIVFQDGTISLFE